MRRWLRSLTLLAWASSPCSAQDHLTPDRAAYIQTDQYPNNYLIKVGHVFSQAFEDGVALRAITLHSLRIDGQNCVGILIKEGQAEAFILEPTSSLLLSQHLEDSLARVEAYKADGEEMPKDLTEQMEYLRSRKAEDYRKIKAIRRARPIPAPLANQIKAVWEAMLLKTRFPIVVRHGKDGITSHFSAWIHGLGEISGNVWSPEAGSKTEKLTSLARTIGRYARGEVELAQLQDEADQAKAAILANPTVPKPLGQ